MSAQDKPHGEGKYSQPSGYVYEGGWEAGAATSLASLALPSLWVSPAATLVLSGLRAAGLAPPTAEEEAVPRRPGARTPDG